MAIEFDTEGALKEGYTYDQIAEHLSQRAGFNLEGALKEGYSAQEIVEHLTGSPAQVAAREEIPTEAPQDPEAALIGETGRGGYTEDVGRQLALTGRAAIKGVTALPALLGDALNSSINAAFGTNLGMVSDLTSNLADAVAVPKNEQERIVAASAETLASLIGSGGVGAAAKWLVSNGKVAANKALQIAQEFSKNLLGQASVGAATAGVGQAVTEVTDSPAAGLAAGLATAFAGGRRANLVKAGKIPPRTASQIYKEADDSYEAAKQAGVTFKAVHSQRLPRKIEKQLYDETLPFEGEGMKTVKSVFDEFDSTVTNALNRGEPVSMEAVETFRKKVNTLIADAGANQAQRRAGYLMRGQIDEWMSQITKNNIVGGSVKAKDTLIKARGQFRTASRVSVLEDVIETAKRNAEVDSKTSFAKELERGFVRLAKNDKKLKANFNASEIKQIKEIAKGGKWTNMLIKGTGVFAGLAGRIAAVSTALGGNIAGVIAYPVAVGSQRAVMASAASQREQAARALAARVAGAGITPEPSRGVVGGLFGIESISP